MTDTEKSHEKGIHTILTSKRTGVGVISKIRRT